MRPATTCTQHPNSVECAACVQRCVLKHDDEGPCRVRCNRGGRFLLMVGEEFAGRLTRIEETGFNHVRPGSRALVLGLPCDQPGVPAAKHRGWMGHRSVVPQQTAQLDDWLDRAAERNCESVHLANPEASFYAEAVYELLRAARERGLLALINTHGAMTPEVIDSLAPVLDGACLAVATLDEDTAQQVGSESPYRVRDTLRWLRERRIWVETHTVLRRGMNDTERSLKETALSIAQTDSTVPWHVHSDYLDEALSHRLSRLADQSGLQNFYCREMHDRQLTLCTPCRAVLISRFHSEPIVNRTNSGACPRCGHVADGLFQRRRMPSEVFGTS